MTGSNYPQTGDSAAEKQEQRKEVKNCCVHTYLCRCVCLSVYVCMLGSDSANPHGSQRQLTVLLPNPV